MMPEREEMRFPAMAPPSGSPSATETPPSSSPFDLDRRIEEQRLRLEVTGSLDVLLKRPCHFTFYNPRSKM
jgi:hypothetical protein